MMKAVSPTLEEPKVKTLLDRLYAQARANDDRVMPQIKAASEQGVRDDRQLAPLLDNAFMAIAPEVGRLFYVLVRAHKPKLVVEFGTSFGLSAIHIAAALRDNGWGRLITAEQSPHKVKQAGAHLAEAGLADLVEIYAGDAFQTLADTPPVDLLVLDGWKALYLPLLKQLEPRLSKGCLVIADDTTLMRETLAEYLAYVRNPANGYISSEIPIDDGLELSIR
jgi:predicted O-methyltransferase YrrM